MDRNYTLSIAVGILLIAEELTRLESKEERRRKKQSVVERKRKLLRETFPEPTAGLSLEGDAVRLLSGDWTKDEAIAFLIDLAFTNPFAPYELRYRASDFERASRQLARPLLQNFL